MTFDPTRRRAHESARMKARTREIRQQQVDTFSAAGIAAIALGSMIGAVAGEFAKRKVFGE